MNRFMKVKREFKRPRHKFIILAALAFLGLLLFLKTRLVPKPFIISCNYNISNYSLPVLKRNDTLPTRSIFFIEPSCVYNLTSRQSCAIESAAKSNPKWQINVVSAGLSLKTVENLIQFKNLVNIKFWKIHFKELSRGTALENLVASGILQNCWNIERTLDVLKYLILGKWGGIYVDLDMTVVRPFGSLARNWVARENNEVIAEGIFGFSKDRLGKFAAETAIRYIQTNSKKRDYCNGRRILNEVLLNLCSTSDVSIMSSAICNGYEVYGSQFFYPVAKEHARDLFTPGELKNHNAYTYYLWGEDTKNYKVMKGSPYTKLAKIYCPNTYQVYGNNFGL